MIGDERKGGGAASISWIGNLLYLFAKKVDPWPNIIAIRLGSRRNNSPFHVASLGSVMVF